DRAVCPLVDMIFPAMPEADVVRGVVDDRRANRQAIEILRVALAFLECLAPTLRAPDHIGELLRPAVEDLDQVFCRQRNHVVGPIRPVDAPLRRCAPWIRRGIRRGAVTAAASVSTASAT